MVSFIDWRGSRGDSEACAYPIVGTGSSGIVRLLWFSVPGRAERGVDRATLRHEMAE